mgnify:CR=1 FL=1
MKLSELHLGQRVIHPQLGEGVVKAINEFAAEILFLEGRKPVDPEASGLVPAEAQATLAGLPSISVPAGFGANGLPMGLALIGKPQGDWALLKLAHAYEKANQELINRRPPGV